MPIMMIVLKNGVTIHADVRWVGGDAYKEAPWWDFTPWRTRRRQQLLYLDRNEVAAVMRLPDAKKETAK